MGRAEVAGRWWWQRAGRPIESSQRPRQEAVLLWSRTRMRAVAEESSHCRDRHIPEAGATGLAEDRTGVKDDALILSLSTQGPQLGPPGARASLSLTSGLDRKSFTVLQGFYQTSSLAHCEEGGTNL